MSWKNTADRWGPVSQSLHWLIVILIVVMAYLGLTMTGLPNSPQKISVYSLHKSIGLTILALVALRLLWRLFAGAPRPVASMPPWQARTARITHWALYALLFALPISGWFVNSAAGFPLQWFHLVNLPAIAAKSESARELAASTHQALFWALLALAVLHAAAAFHHHLFLGDDTLARMLPRRLFRTRSVSMPGEIRDA